MNIEKQEQAKDLYFQTDLTKTQIAEMLGIPRRTLHYWIRSKNWDRLKECSAHMPALSGRLIPLMDDYIAERVSITTADLRPDNFNNMGLIPQPEYDYREDQLDCADYGAWKHGDDDGPNPEQLDEVPLGI